MNAENNAQVISKKPSGTYTFVNSWGFSHFQLKDDLMMIIRDCGFEHPTIVQHLCLPPAMLGVDILCRAASGKGKTSMFILATLQKLNRVFGEISVLILCPNELANQIAEEYEKFSKNFNISICICIEATLQRIQKGDCPNIIIGTPTAISSLVESRKQDFKLVSYIVIDECDQILEQNDTKKAVQKIFANTPNKKQVMSFSSTPRDCEVEVYVGAEAVHEQLLCNIGDSAIPMEVHETAPLPELGDNELVHELLQSQNFSGCNAANLQHLKSVATEQYLQDILNMARLYEERTNHILWAAKKLEQSAKVAVKEASLAVTSASNNTKFIETTLSTIQSFN